MSRPREAVSVNVGSCDFCSAVHINLLDADGECFATAALPVHHVDEFCRRMCAERDRNLGQVPATAVRQ